MDDLHDKPYCYGKIDCVFPMGDDGLRHSPESCMPCFCKTDCLRSALKEEGGISVREEVVDRAYSSGAMGFFERWSRKKALSRKKDESSRKSGKG
ncbi:MAG: hypothetical protein ACOWWM_20645 [Desulfobacterales bacterium]